MTKDERKTEKLSLQERIKANLKILSEETDEDSIKGVVCVFYKGGKNQQCVGCLQPTNVLMDCRKDYIQKIELRPMEYWTPDFDKKTVRERKPIKEVEVGLACDKCQISDSCPLFDIGSLCGIAWDIESKNPKDLLDWAINLQAKRVNRAATIESMEGGVPDVTVSNEMDRMSKLVALKADLEQDKFSLKIEGTAQGNGGGILASLFGDMAGKPKQLDANNQPLELNPTTANILATPIEFDEKVLLGPDKKKERKKERKNFKSKKETR